ncbi:DUF1295 domain-containing protein [Martelella endophytica]|uniref:Membrane protein n=1 Tax=Martelella endophytica TaxID=1486262 RepID=A0A0D5LW89_MAREN|nr:DUF1295 domain-containing protein [Martelella endophytica]AJY48225.1 membrane protein [Martelella endophytica]
MSLAILLILFVGLCAGMAIAWAVQRSTGNSGWIDTIWAALCGIAGLFVIIAAEDGNPGRKWFAGLIVGIWAVRLAGHIAMRSSGKKDDPRYAALIESWGDKASIRLLWFLEIQAFAAFVLALSIYAAILNPAPFPGVLDLLALIVALVAIAGEGTADYQLSKFKKEKPVGKSVCDIGLWSWSRHPNYFFEWLWWCAWPLVAYAGFERGWIGFLAFLAPVMMYWLLNHVSGIPYLEEHMEKTRGEAFAAYKRRVSAFFPRPPRQE